MGIRILLTGAGGAGTIAVMEALRATGDYFIIAADAAHYSAGFAQADRAYVLPFGNDPRFESAMRSILDQEQPDFVVPLVDEEIPIVHRLAQEQETRVVTPRPDFCDAVNDKWVCARRLHEGGLSTAPTWLASDAEGCTYPAIIKPRDGRGSRGFAHLRDVEDLAAYLREAPEPADRYVVQRRIEGTEYTTSVVVGLDGTTLTVVPKEVVVKKGITQVGTTRHVPEIEELGRAIQTQLRADGPFNVQLIMGADRVPYVIEINPRYSTTVALTLASGVNEVDAVVRHALGQDPGSLDFRPDLMMIRYATQLYVDEREWAPASYE